jgi:DUF2914 family protein
MTDRLEGVARDCRVILLLPMLDAHKRFLESTFVGRIATRYARYERAISSASLFGGFAFDALTLKRVDTFWENFWVLVHLLLVAACILWDNRAGSKDEPGSHFWTVNVLQFLFGGLLSTFLVFYFRSGSLGAGWPFFLLLAVAFLANEKLKDRLARLDFQLSFFFLSLFAFAIFIVPVLVHAIGRLVFLLSGGISLILIWLFLRVLQFVGRENFSAGRRGLTVCILSIFLAINFLYFLNLIPPIPLSLQDAGIGHSVERTADGSYLLQSEEQGWLRFFRWASKIHISPGAPVYVYSAVFSPTRLNTDIVHEWQQYDGRRGWVTTDRIALPVRGGRGGGYRTYSAKGGIRPGAWRVNVETPTGAVLGRVRFDVLPPSGDLPSLKTEIKD